MIIPQTQIKQFQKEILTWYKKNKRDLPWRGISNDISLDHKAYRILVSEIMSQQTQISRVVSKYEAWLQVFPTVESLANAKTSEVLKHWSGLGYNRRALYLQKCAKEITEKHNGIFPKEILILKTLPGIGEYTAAAVACFAFGQQIAVVDTNVRKVILKKFPIKNYVLRIDEKKIKTIAGQLLPVGRASEWNQALMDYASAMLKHEKIPVTQQSTFKGSDRYYRGRIVKLLLEKPSYTASQLYEALSEDGVLEKPRFDIIVEGLIKDQVIEKRNTLITFVQD